MATTIILDPGHGGKDPGGVGYIKEAELVYRWASVLREKLEAEGYNVAMLPPPAEGEKLTLPSRVSFANGILAVSDSINHVIFISVHANAFKTASAHGSEVFIYRDTSAVAHLARDIAVALADHDGGVDRGLKTANFYVLKYTKMPAMLLEIGFVTNKEEAEWLSNNIEAQAESVFRAIHSNLPPRR